MRPPESFIEQPVRSLQTMLRVLAEDDRSLPTVVPDGIYGPNTMNAVTALQRHEGLPVTGVVDQLTWDRIVEIYKPALVRIGKAQPIEVLLEPGQILRSGDSNPYIYLLQAMLMQLSNDHPQIIPPSSTGVLDAETEESILQFQKLAGLVATGEVDRLTWKHLVLQFTLNAHHNQAKISPFANSEHHPNLQQY